MIPRTLLVAASPFGPELDAERVGEAIARGLRAAGRSADACPLEEDTKLDALGFDARMRAARAVVIAEPALREQTLAGSLAFEIATRARQGGVPAYAITGENLLDSFDARILDLQTILEARTHRALTAAGRKLAKLL
ncbi:MAG TPA: glycerate kinase [Solirubrobacteraceae bacterium]|nr:glycerate kinase [Solirubrobacteraceae bacterium]